MTSAMSNDVTSSYERTQLKNTSVFERYTWAEFLAVSRLSFVWCEGRIMTYNGPRGVLAYAVRCRFVIPLLDLFRRLRTQESLTKK